MASWQHSLPDFRKPLRTQQYDPGQLNSPDFVGSFSHGDHVYFFFREGAVEHINCGKAVFSRVARVCKRDQGGPNKAKYVVEGPSGVLLGCFSR